MISRRHRGTEMNATVSAMLVVNVRCEDAKVRLRFSSRFDRLGQACLNAIRLFQSMKLSPCLCGSVRAESREPSANKSFHASGRQRRFPIRRQTRPPRELGRYTAGRATRQGELHGGVSLTAG
jgi:hypothetical protein